MICTSITRNTSFTLAAMSLLAVFTASGCASGAGDGEAKGAGTAPGEPRGASSSGLDKAAAGDAPYAPRSPSPQVKAGILTAGAWDDNQNFARFIAYKTQLAAYSTSRTTMPFTLEEHQAAFDVFSNPRRPRQKLDIALVIDTTGSMGDELAYLQREFIALSTFISARYPDAEQRWALVAYKDVSDEYTTRWFDFRSDPMEFKAKLAAQTAGGGGDYPEATDAALVAMNQLGWRTGNDVARLAFWVADAPHHNERVNNFAHEVRATKKQDIHVYPVASSGVDELTELSMRSTAQLTGGRYLFLTDDSGVGSSHKEPSIPCYFVTRLDAAILRMVDAEMTGTRLDPAARDVVRTGGDPKAGACTLQSGEVVSIF